MMWIHHFPIAAVIWGSEISPDEGLAIIGYLTLGCFNLKTPREVQNEIVYRGYTYDISNINMTLRHLNVLSGNVEVLEIFFYPSGLEICQRNPQFGGLNPGIDIVLDTPPQTIRILQPNIICCHVQWRVSTVGQSANHMDVVEATCFSSKAASEWGEKGLETWTSQAH